MPEQTRPRRLPAGQPWRALTVVSAYVVVVGVAALPFLLLFGTALGSLLLVGFACLLTVPVAIAAPRPKAQPSAQTNKPALIRVDTTSSSRSDHDAS